MNAITARILIAEDNEINQKVLKIILDKNGYQYDMVQNGNDAIKQYQDGAYDLILMDCQMPEMDGLEASRRIREFETHSQKKRAPIIAMTANAMSGDKEKCFEAGMDSFLAKPFKSQDLLQAILTWSQKIGAS